MVSRRRNQPPSSKVYSRQLRRLLMGGVGLSERGKSNPLAIRSKAEGVIHTPQNTANRPA